MPLSQLLANRVAKEDLICTWDCVCASNIPWIVEILHESFNLGFWMRAAAIIKISLFILLCSLIWFEKEEIISKNAAAGKIDRPFTQWSCKYCCDGQLLQKVAKTCSVSRFETEIILIMKWEIKDELKSTRVHRPLKKKRPVRDNFSPEISVILCALVPWNANALIPAWNLLYIFEDAFEHFCLWIHHFFFVFLCDTSKEKFEVIWIDKDVKWKIKSTVFFSSCSIAFTRPNNPDAGSLWPDNDLAADTMRGVLLLPLPIILLRAPNSMGSPRAVPVPWSCIKSNAYISKNSPFSLESVIAILMQSCCDGPFGAVSELERPSWLTAEPINLIRMNSLFRILESIATMHSSLRT